MTKFDEQFYSHADLSQPLAEALFANAEALPANHLHPIINLTTGLVQRCPPHHRESFLPPLLISLFTKLERRKSGPNFALSSARMHRNPSPTTSDPLPTTHPQPSLPNSRLSIWQIISQTAFSRPLHVRRVRKVSDQPPPLHLRPWEKPTWPPRQHAALPALRHEHPRQPTDAEYPRDG